MNLYVVVNKEGKYFRPVGFGGFGEHWVDDIKRAKFYPNIGAAKSRCTYFFSHYPEYGCPQILEFTLEVENAKILNVENLTKKAVSKKKIQKLQDEKRQKEQEIDFLRKQRDEINKKLENPLMNA